MGLTSAIKTSILGLLAAEPTHRDSTLADQLEAIRYAMLSVLGDDAMTDSPGLVRRIKYADDIGGLWFLRSELMAALAQMYGEHKARDVIQHLSSMFKGFVPDAKAGSNSRYNSR